MKTLLEAVLVAKPETALTEHAVSSACHGQSVALQTTSDCQSNLHSSGQPVESLTTWLCPILVAISLLHSS